MTPTVQEVASCPTSAMCATLTLCRCNALVHVLEISYVPTFNLESRSADCTLFAALNSGSEDSASSYCTSRSTRHHLICQNNRLHFMRSFSRDAHPLTSGRPCLVHLKRAFLVVDSVCCVPGRGSAFLHRLLLNTGFVLPCGGARPDTVRDHVWCRNDA